MPYDLALRQLAINLINMAWIFYPLAGLTTQQFYLHQGETLLAGLLRVGVKARYECRQGYCGVCKVRYHKRTADTRIDYTVPPLVMLADDELLPCCCRVQGALAVDIAAAGC